MAGTFATVGATLGLDITPFEQGLARSSASVEKFGGKLVNKMMGPRAVMGSLATALGIGFSHIADSAARMWAGMTEKAEEYYKKVEQLSEEAADMQIKAMRRTLPEWEKRELLKKDLADLRKGNGDRPETRERGWEEKIMTFGGLGVNPFYLAGNRLRENREEENRQAVQASQLKNKKREIELTTEIAELDEKIGDTEAATNKKGAEAMQKYKELRLKQQQDQADENKKGAEALQKYHELRKKQTEEIREKEAKAALEFQHDIEERKKKEKDLADDIIKAQKAVAKSAADLQDALSDRSASTLQELADDTQAPGRVQAREIIRLEQRAKLRRATGFSKGAAEDIAKADKLRAALGALKKSERFPQLDITNKILEDSKALQAAIKASLQPVGGISSGKATGKPIATGKGGAPAEGPTSGITGFIGGLGII